MKNLSYDIAVIGGGAAGLSAAAKCAEMGARTVVIERNERLGGVLLQCIHNGFGLHYFHQELTGPEYAYKVRCLAEEKHSDFMTGASVMNIAENGGGHLLTIYSKEEGVVMLQVKAVILAMGCRERCRGNIGTPGDRCAGIFSAGTAQQLINIEGILPGHRAVIVGSGDIGLIMARRLTWSGVKVECVIEIMPYPAGLSRNIAQCLEDFNIPLLLSTGVTGIYGKPRVQHLTYAPLVDGKPDLSQEKCVDCDCVLFSVGLVPENELAKNCGVQINSVTNGPIVDGQLMTSVPGVFSCGNGLHVHDLVDFVSQEAERCAESAVNYCNGGAKRHCGTALAPGEGVRYVVPNTLDCSVENRMLLRSRAVMDSARLLVQDENGREILSKSLRYVKPAEMLEAIIPAESAAAPKKLTVSLQYK